jgi:tRNA nucleotidyltransferase/poly(A) polymerase
MALQRLYDTNVWSLLLANTSYGLIVDYKNIGPTLTELREFYIPELDLWDEKKMRVILAWALVRQHTLTEHHKNLEQYFLFSREEAQILQGLPQLVSQIRQINSESVADYKTLLAHENFFIAATLIQILSSEDRLAIPHLRHRKNLFSSNKLKPDPLLTGRDLIALGIQPGPEVKEILANVYRAQLEEKIFTREEALKLAVPIKK